MVAFSVVAVAVVGCIRSLVYDDKTHKYFIITGIMARYLAARIKE